MHRVAGCTRRSLRRPSNFVGRSIGTSAGSAPVSICPLGSPSGGPSRQYLARTRSTPPPRHVASSSCSAASRLILAARGGEHGFGQHKHPTQPKHRCPSDGLDVLNSPADKPVSPNSIVCINALLTVPTLLLRDASVQSLRLQSGRNSPHAFFKVTY
jgi:hypothetical protein